MSGKRLLVMVSTLIRIPSFVVIYFCILYIWYFTCDQGIISSYGMPLGPYTSIPEFALVVYLYVVNLCNDFDNFQKEIENKS